VLSSLVIGDVFNYRPAKIMQRVIRIKALCRRHNVDLAAAALRFSLGHPTRG
jgi:D-threo-aldose 1-dehydrogenase